MAEFRKELENMGLNALPLSQQELTLLEQFLSISSPFFDSVCLHRADKPTQDLVLGLLTQSHQQAFDAYQATEPKITELKAMFSDKVGAEHAKKFTALNQDELIVISLLWFMAQGFTGIDFSYANDHAEETAELININQPDSSQEKEIKQLRTRFMQAYYIGIDCAHDKANPTPLFITIKSLLKRLFASKE